MKISSANQSEPPKLSPPGRHSSPQRLQLPACVGADGSLGTRVPACMQKQLTCLGKTGARGRIRTTAAPCSWTIRSSCHLPSLPCSFSSLLLGGKGMLGMTCGELGERCGVTAREWKAEKCLRGQTPVRWACLGENSLSSTCKAAGQKVKTPHSGQPHPHCSNELLHLLNEAAFSLWSQCQELQLHDT